LVAVTAFGTLTRGLNYGGVLTGIERSDLWSVTAAPGEVDLAALGDQLVNRTSVFVNPNKHRCRVWSEGSDAATMSGDAWILVWDSEETEGRRALAELRGAGFDRKVEAISKATLWRLSLAESAKGRELALAEEMAVAVRREQGLLANPHIHRWSCGVGSISLEEAVARLNGAEE
jgi:hypothetical protein